MPPAGGPRYPRGGAAPPHSGTPLPYPPCRGGGGAAPPAPTASPTKASRRGEWGGWGWAAAAPSRGCDSGTERGYVVVGRVSPPGRGGRAPSGAQCRSAFPAPRRRRRRRTVPPPGARRLRTAGAPDLAGGGVSKGPLFDGISVYRVYSLISTCFLLLLPRLLGTPVRGGGAPGRSPAAGSGGGGGRGLPRPPPPAAGARMARRPRHR